MDFDRYCIFCGSDSMDYIEDGLRSKMCVDCGFKWFVDEKKADKKYSEEIGESFDYKKAMQELDDLSDYLNNLI